MQDALTRAFVASKLRQAGAAVVRRDPSFMRVWQSTLNVFARHPLHVTFWAASCFAGAGVVGSLVYAAIIGDAVIRTGTHSNATFGAYNAQMLVQAGIGVFAWQLGRGAITWVAMQGQETPITVRATLSAVLRAWLPLMLSALVYGALITLGLLGLTMLLREMRLDVTNARWARGDMSSVLHWTNVRAIAALPPDPGSPFTDWLAATRYNMARAAGNSAYLGFDLGGYLTRGASLLGLLIGSASILLMFVVDAVLCMRTAAIFGAQDGWDWLRTSLRTSAMHFWRVAGWRWTLRLAIAAVMVAALILPPALHQAVLMNEVRRAIGVGGYWPYHIAQSAYGVGSALISSLLIACGVVFEARMFVALARGRRNPAPDV
jgi:hypothetical protein